MALAQTGTSRPAGNGVLFFRSSGKALLTEINKGIIWWISSVLVRKPLTDIHVAVANSDKGAVVENKCVPAPMSLAFVLFKGSRVFCTIFYPAGSSAISTLLPLAAREMPRLPDLPPRNDFNASRPS
jgi:hypothetical protein